MGGPTSFTFVLDLLSQTIECSDNSHDESSWSQMVYYPLLRNSIEWAPVASATTAPQLREGDVQRGEEGRPVVIPCTTASILEAYRVDTRSSKMVDYTIAIQPNSMSAQSAVDRARRSSRTGSINHTDFVALVQRPIVLSIEVKRIDGHEKSKLQLGVWLAAQWRKVDELSRENNKPEFLLAIIISGHDWSLAASSREENQRVVSFFLLPLFID